MRFIHKLLPETLLIRFILIITLPTLIGQILIIFLFYDRHWYNVSYYTSNMIVNEILSLVEENKNNLLKNNTLETNYLNLSYKIYTKNIMPKIQPKISEELGIFKNILDIKINKRNVIRVNRLGKIEVYLELKNKILIISFPTKLLMNPTSYIFVLWLIFLSFSLISISLIFSKNQIKSILLLADAADQFGRGIKNIKTFYPSGAKEIKKAGIAFLKMKARIERQVLKRTKMLAMISHDLCTPLTRMKLQLELMHDSYESQALKQDIVVMQEMIKSYLDFTKGEYSEEYQETSIIEWIEKIIKKSYASDIKLLTNGVNIKIKIQKNNLERAITNLINNAIKYSTKILLSLYSSDNNIIIEIEDNGPGIPNIERSLVFKPFYRSDKSRSLNYSGNVGLGLAITKEIIIKHNGTIILEDSKNLGGLLVRITLPKNL